MTRNCWVFFVIGQGQTRELSRATEAESLAQGASVCSVLSSAALKGKNSHIPEEIIRIEFVRTHRARRDFTFSQL